MKMTNSEFVDLYTDFLIVNTQYATATSLSSALGASVSHDSITRLLNGTDINSKALWQVAKPLIRKYGSPSGILAIDDTVAAKPHMQENEIITWHYDHSVGRKVKGFNLLTAVYTNGAISVPIGFEIVRKTRVSVDEVTGKETRKAEITKNEHFRTLVTHACRADVPFRLVVADNWYSSTENMRFIKREMKKDFVFGLKSNRKVALTAAEAKRKVFVSLADLKLEPGALRAVWLEGLDFPVYIAREVYANEDGKTADLYLICSDATCDYQNIISPYAQRWSCETYHKTLKSNLALTKSPARTLRAIANHVGACLCAFVKAEALTQQLKIKQFTLKAKLYQNALNDALKEISRLCHKLNCRINLNPA